MGKLIVVVATFLIWLTIVVASIGGWIANIIKLVNHTGFGIEEVLRIVGIFFAPLGVVMGFV